MNLTVENIGLSLEIDYDLLDELVKIGRSHYPNEFGGFLIGHYSEDNRHLHISNSILPIVYKGSKYSFERSTKGIEEKLMDYYQENPKKFYVGEWHTHPNNLAVPSNIDINSLVQIANSNEGSIENPVLLIIGYDQVKTQMSFYIMFNGNLYKYE